MQPGSIKVVVYRKVNGRTTEEVKNFDSLTPALLFRNSCMNSPMISKVVVLSVIDVYVQPLENRHEYRRDAHDLKGVR